MGPNGTNAGNESQRICSDAYFARYFPNYGIPPRDVSDEAISDVLAAAETSVEATTELLAKYGREGAAGMLVRKLRSREKLIPKENAKHLALAVARSGVVFPRERSMYSFVVSTFAQAGILAANLTRLIPSERSERVRDRVDHHS